MNGSKAAGEYRFEIIQKEKKNADEKCQGSGASNELCPRDRKSEERGDQPVPDKTESASRLKIRLLEQTKPDTASSNMQRQQKIFKEPLD